MRDTALKVLAVVPARGGSKSVPRKNITLLAGRPLICYTIEEAKRSASIDRLVVSTDAEDIAAIARECGAEVIMRPPEFATDTARTELALIHVCETLERTEDYRADIIVTLEPTSPLRSHALIDECIQMFALTDADSVLSVLETRECIGRIVAGRFEYLIQEQPRRRQDREPLYKETSTVYATRADVLLKRRSVLGDRLYAVIANREEAIDINTPLDFVIVEAVMRWKTQGGAGR